MSKLSSELSRDEVTKYDGNVYAWKAFMTGYISGVVMTVMCTIPWS